MVHNVALYRALSDYRQSLLHDYERFSQALTLCVPYLSVRAGLSKRDAEQRLARSELLDRHWLSRGPWSGISMNSPTLHEQAPVRVASTCLNAGVLLALAELRSKTNVRVDCSYLTPLEYWSSPTLADDVDVFVTEVSSPYISGTQAGEVFQLALPIHLVAEGVITKNPLLYLPYSTPRRTSAIVTAGTSTVTHAKQRFGRNIEEIPDASVWRSVLASITDAEVFFAWEPWLYLIEKSLPEMHVIRDGQFIIGMFVANATLEDAARRPAILGFLDAFVRQWRSLVARRDAITESDLRRLDEFAGWSNTFNRAMLVAVSSVEVEHVVTTAVRGTILKLIGTIRESIGPEPRLIEEVAPRIDDIERHIGRLLEKDLQPLLVLVEDLVKSHDKRPWAQIDEIHAFLRTRAQMPARDRHYR